MTADRIELRGLHVLARCGVLPLEQAQDQPFEIDVDVVCDLAAAGVSDDLADTIDYGTVCDLLEQVARAGPTALMERLAQQLADAVLGFDPRVASVALVVRKLRPPVPQHLATSAVRIERSRQ